MHRAGQEALQQLALAHDNDSLGLGACGQVVEARDRLPLANEPVEEHCSSREKRDRDCKNEAEGGGGYGIHFCFRSSDEIAGTISLRSPTTA